MVRLKLAFDEMIAHKIITFDAKSTTQDNSKKFIATISIKKWEDVETSVQNDGSLKALYDSIDGIK